MTDQADLLVAGAGPVGLATAIIARRAGLDVVVVDPREDPIDKACGEGLMPAAVVQLRELGVELEGRPFRGIRYLMPGHVAQARFQAGPGLGVRRTELQAALAARAADVGVRRHQGRVTEVRQDGGCVEAAGVTARWLVGADGLHSQVRRELGLQRSAPGPRRFGHRRHVGIQPWTDLVEVHWAEHAEAYVTPVADDVVGVAVLCGQGQRYDEVLDGFPALRERIGSAPAVSTVTGAGPLRQVASKRVRGRALLVGDASGYVDALTGEGISVGLACARAAVAAIVAGRPEDYERSWRAASRRYRVLTASLVWAAGRPRLRRQVVPAASRLPWVFDAAVGALAR